MTPRIDAGADVIGRWGDARIDDAIRTARLADLQAPLQERRTERDRSPKSPETRGRVHAARVRLGRAVSGVGRFIEGRPECPDTVSGAA